MVGLGRFAGRILGVATIHGKEGVIGPALQQALSLAGFTAIDGVDTDRFGAFSGEVKRTLDPLEACKAKARHGADVGGFDLVVASEGSFFPYPLAPFVPCNEEVLVLYDARDDRFFDHRHVSLETVFGGAECTSWEGVKAFADRMKFPEHGLVVRAREHWSMGDAMRKGIVDAGELRELTGQLITTVGSCWVETDMRAMMNPTRMRVIAASAERFAHELGTVCPSCGACWFRVTQAIPGLPCGLCGLPTEGTRAYQRACWCCARSATVPRPDGRTSADPQHCPHCNP